MKNIKELSIALEKALNNIDNISLNEDSKAIEKQLFQIVSLLNKASKDSQTQLNDGQRLSKILNKIGSQLEDELYQVAHGEYN